MLRALTIIKMYLIQQNIESLIKSVMFKRL
jgi:hypothetical protein